MGVTQHFISNLILDPVEADAVACPHCREGILTGIMVLRA